jgi:hypothetical protein
VVTHAWFWVRPHYNSSQRDIEQVYYFMEHATRLVLPGSVADPGDKLPIFADERKTWEFIKHEPIWFEIGATALLGMIVVMLSQAPLKAN